MQLPYKSVIVTEGFESHGCIGQCLGRLQTCGVDETGGVCTACFDFHCTRAPDHDVQVFHMALDHALGHVKSKFFVIRIT